MMTTKTKMVVDRVHIDDSIAPSTKCSHEHIRLIRAQINAYKWTHIRQETAGLSLSLSLSVSSPHTHTFKDVRNTPFAIHTHPIYEQIFMLLAYLTQNLGESLS